MAMHNGLNIGPRLVNLAMDKTLQKTGAAIRADSIAVEVVLDDVVGCDQRRRDRARHQITVGCSGMAHRNVAEAIDNPVRRKYAARRSEIRNERGGDRAAGFIRHRMM